MIGYVAKDRDGEVYFHKTLPFYDDELDSWFSSPDSLNIRNEFPEFNDMSFRDKPIKVELNIKRI